MRRCAPVLCLSGQHTSSLPRGIMLMGGPPSLSPSLHSPSLLSGSACLRALLLVLTEHPLIVGISPACLAKPGEGDLRLLWVFGAPLEPDASCFYPHQERACTPQGLPTAMGSHNHLGSVRTHAAHTHAHRSSYHIQKTKYSLHINSHAKPWEEKADATLNPQPLQTSCDVTWR